MISVGRSRYHAIIIKNPNPRAHIPNVSRRVSVLAKEEDLEAGSG